MDSSIHPRYISSDAPSCARAVTTMSYAPSAFIGNDARFNRNTSRIIRLKRPRVTAFPNRRPIDNPNRCSCIPLGCRWTVIAPRDLRSLASKTCAYIPPGSRCRRRKTRRSGSALGWVSGSGIIHKDRDDACPISAEKTGLRGTSQPGFELAGHPPRRADRVGANLSPRTHPTLCTLPGSPAGYPHTHARHRECRCWASSHHTPCGKPRQSIVFMPFHRVR